MPGQATFTLSRPNETALHAVTECPRYAARRAQLIHNLHDYLVCIRERARTHQHMRQIIYENEKSLLLHVMCGTPFVLSCLSSDEERSRLLTLTGEFLEFMCSIRTI